jgi:hypothetical protein
MIRTLLILSLSVAILTQPGALLDTAAIKSVLSATSTTTGTATIPGPGATMDTANTDAVQTLTQPTQMPAGVSAYMVPSAGSQTYNAATTAWTYLQQLGGACCNNCSKICGFGIRFANSNYYLTNKGTYFTFEYSNNLNSSQIFTIGQNADCTWYISNGGRYLSTTSIYSGAWVGTATTVGQNERWYIEKSNGYNEVQSAASQYNYWRVTSSYPYFLGYSYGYSTRLVFEYVPCDKAYGWNW